MSDSLPSLDLFDKLYSDFPAKARTLIKDIENELDIIWAGWRQKQRFDSVEYDLKARIKWLLKKHSLLTQREGPTPCPKYWDVIIVQDSKNKSLCYAHPVIPAISEQVTTRNPVSPLESIKSPEQPISLPALAIKLKTSLEAVESLYEHAPESCITVQDYEEYITKTVKAIKAVI